MHRALAFDDPAHALELSGMRVATCLEAKQSAFLCEGLFEFDASALRSRHQLGAGRLQKLGIGGVRHCLLLHGGVHHDSGQGGSRNEPQRDGQGDGLGEQLFYALFTKEAAEFDQGGGVAGQAFLVVRQPTEELPAWGLGPTLDQRLVADD